MTLQPWNTHSTDTLNSILTETFNFKDWWKLEHLFVKQFEQMFELVFSLRPLILNNWWKLEHFFVKQFEQTFELLRDCLNS